ncbi:MAG: PEP-CTERM sorting domain-containing protein [Planctomycetes bacterium]|nr:PEP-CTERM sorting domain-containing protein [Planctomycetota bacterium]
MPSSKKLYSFWLILTVTMTCPVMAQTESYHLKDQGFKASDHSNWIFSLPTSRELPILSETYSFQLPSTNGAGLFSESITGVYESFQVNPPGKNLTISSVPEPATILILGAGLLVLVKLYRRRHPAFA